MGGSFRTFALKAKGGRETRPSIFAEAGIPEWYIPEEHTDNTLDLVLAAAYGSGFSILDLAERAGARLFADGGTDGSTETVSANIFECTEWRESDDHKKRIKRRG